MTGEPLELLTERKERASREASFLLAEKRELDRRYSEAQKREAEAKQALDAFLADASLVGVVGSRSRKSSHDGKAGFYTPASALMASIEMRKRLWNLWPYKCGFCPHYHLGNLPAAVREMAHGFVGLS